MQRRYEAGPLVEWTGKANAWSSIYPFSKNDRLQSQWLTAGGVSESSCRKFKVLELWTILITTPPEPGKVATLTACVMSVLQTHTNIVIKSAQVIS